MTKLTDLGISEHLIRSVTATISDIPLIELNTIYLALILGMPVKDRLGYEQTKFLFTVDNGSKMHPDVETIFIAYVEKLLNEKK